MNLDGSSATISSWAYDFDGVGRRTGVIDAAGQQSGWQYDRTGQLLSEAYGLGGLSWARLSLAQWNALTADDWDVLEVDSVPAYERVTVYDSAGNRLTHTDPDTGSVTTSTYDAANRLLTSADASGVTTYTYDGNGNQLTIEEPGGEVTTNTWDGENRLVQVEHPDFSITTYVHDGDGHKVAKDDGVEITRFVHDGNNLLRETDDLGVVEAELP